MKKIAICFYGFNDGTFDLEAAKQRILIKFKEFDITFFAHYCAVNTDTEYFKSLYTSSSLKRNFEIDNHLEFDTCVAIDVTAINLLYVLCIHPTDVNVVSSVTGRFDDVYYVTGIGMEMFYASSEVFDRACELYLHLPHIEMNKIRGFGMMEFDKSHIFYYHLKSMFLNTKCINYENRSLFKRPT